MPLPLTKPILYDAAHTKSVHSAIVSTVYILCHREYAVKKVVKEQRGQLRINNTTFSSETVYNLFIVSNRELPYPGVGGSMIIELAGREVLPSSTFQSLSIDRDFCLNLDSDLLGLFL